MNRLLTIGQSVTFGDAAAGDGPWVVDALIGIGGAGQVYRVRRGDERMAVKWYYPQRRLPSIAAAVGALAASAAPTPRLAWPVATAGDPDAPGFGCLMPLREPRFRSLADLMMNRPTAATYPGTRRLLRAAAELAEAFDAIAARGLAWCDWSPGNVFIDPASGELLLCDVDGLCAAGESRPPFAADPRYAAPELSAGHAPPSPETDRFALAVALFCLLVGAHPFDGPPDAAAGPVRHAAPHDRLRFHAPGDSPARPGPFAAEAAQAAARWHALTDSLRAALRGTLTDGIADPAARPDARAWLAELRAAYDRVACCPRDAFAACLDLEPSPAATTDSAGPRAETFDDLRGTDVAARACPICQGRIAPGPRLVIDRPGAAPPVSVVLLAADVRLYRHHVANDGEPREPVARAQTHPTRPRAIGLRNLGAATWYAALPDGQAKQVEPGQTLELTDGAAITIGDSVCRVHLTAGPDHPTSPLAVSHAAMS